MSEITSSGVEEMSVASLVPHRTRQLASGERMTTERRRSFKKARFHSIWVRIFRVFLPVFGFGAIGALIFVTTFVPKIPLNLGPDINLDTTLSLNGTSILMNNPKLSGFGDGGQAYEVEAASATQSIFNPELINLNGLFAKITLKDGTWADVRSEAGLYDNKSAALSLNREIKVNSSEGYRVTLQNAEVDLKGGTLVSRSPVEVRSDTGFMQANELTIDQSGKRIRFTNGIRLLIVPPKSGGQLVVQE